MSKIFYVIEVNRGSGVTGEYFCEGMGEPKGKHNGYFTTTNIYKALKFFDKESMEAIYSLSDMTLKDWAMTEHIYEN